MREQRAWLVIAALLASACGTAPQPTPNGLELACLGMARRQLKDPDTLMNPKTLNVHQAADESWMVEGSFDASMPAGEERIHGTYSCTADQPGSGAWHIREIEILPAKLKKMER